MSKAIVFRVISLSFVFLLVGVSFVEGSFKWDVEPAQGEIIDIKLTNFELLLDPWEGSDSKAAGNARYSDADIVSRMVAGGVPTTVGQEIYGIAKVTTIKNEITSQTFWTEQAGQELAFRFYGFELASNADPTATSWTGGVVDLFFDSSPDYSTASGPFLNTVAGGGTGWNSVATASLDDVIPHRGVAEWNGVGDAAGDVDESLFLSLSAVQGKTAVAGETLLTNFGVVGAGQVEGSGSSFLEVVYSALFIIGKDTFDFAANPATKAGNQDANLLSDFDSLSTLGPFEPINGWTIGSEDPLSFRYLGQVPEPGAMVVWALLCVVGMCAIRFRKR